MASNFDLVSDIHQRNMHWHIQVYVIRKYEVASFDDSSVVKSIDLILQDSQGGRIHASIPNRLMSTWDSRINEFKMYDMKHFVIVDRRAKVRATQVRWSLLFCNRTEVHEVDLPTFPLEPFRLRTIPELLESEAVTEFELFDLVAEVVGKEDPRDLVTSNGKETKRMAIVLQDNGKNTIRCILFGPVVDILAPLMALERSEPLIIVLNFFRVNRWDGKTSVQSHFDISTICFDANLKEIQDFRNSMVDTGTTSTVRITQLSSQSSGQGIEELRRGQVEITTIEDAWSLIKECQVWIAGTIVTINSGKNGWCYKACQKCPKAVVPKGYNMYECKKCKTLTKGFTYRYKIEIVVYDETATMTLLLWDNEVAELVGVKAQTVKDQMKGDEDGYPPILDELHEKRLLFKVIVKAENISGEDLVFPVMQICDDEDIVERYYSKDDDVQEKNETNHTETDGSNNVVVEGAVVNLKSDTDSQHTMDNLDGSAASIKSKTPPILAADVEGISKRGKKICEDEGNLSTNKFSRKMPKRNKMQINDGDD